MLAKALLMKKKRQSPNLFSGLQIGSYVTTDIVPLYIPANTSFVVSVKAKTGSKTAGFEVRNSSSARIEIIGCNSMIASGDRLYMVLTKPYDIYYVDWNWFSADYTQVELGTVMTPYMPYEGGN